MKITRIRIYRPQKPNPHFNQSDMIVTIETDLGLTGIGEGGSPRHARAVRRRADRRRTPRASSTCGRPCTAATSIPAGREKLHALGALDLALWDLKGKQLNAPVYELLGGLTRDHVECYSTGFPWQGSLAKTASACLQAGFRAFRTAVADPKDGVFDARRMVEQTYEPARRSRAAVGKPADWSIDFHTRLEMPEAVRLCGLIEPLNPLFVEDPLRSENPAALAALRPRCACRWLPANSSATAGTCNELVEKHVIDYARVTLPNVGGITELMKIAALCETHCVGHGAALHRSGSAGSPGARPVRLPVPALVESAAPPQAASPSEAGLHLPRRQALA